VKCPSCRTKIHARGRKRKPTEKKYKNGHKSQADTLKTEENRGVFNLSFLIKRPSSKIALNSYISNLTRLSLECQTKIEESKGKLEKMEQADA